MSEMQDNEGEGQGGAPPDPVPTARPQQERQEPSENAERSARETGERKEGEGEPEAKEHPEREPWFVRRIAELTRISEERGRVLAQAERKLRELLPAPDPDAPPDIDQLATQRASQMVAEREYTAACNASHAAGVAAFPDFADAMQQLASAGGIPRPLVEAALETGEAHKVLYQLGRDPEEAMRIGGLSPARMGVALARLAAKPAPVAAVTRAPAPVRSISGGNVRANDDPEKMSMAEFTAWRSKQEAARRAS